MLKVGGQRVLTKHSEPGGARAHSARIIPCFAVVGACLVWAQRPQLQMGPVPVFSPVQQGPVVEPGWQVGNTTGPSAQGKGCICPSSRMQPREVEEQLSASLRGTTYYGKSSQTAKLGARPLGME